MGFISGILVTTVIIVIVLGLPCLYLINKAEKFVAKANAKKLYLKKKEVEAWEAQWDKERGE